MFPWWNIARFKVNCDVTLLSPYWEPVAASTGREENEASVTDPPQAAPRSVPQSKVNPYSVIEINPLHHHLPEQQHQPLPPTPSPTESKDQAREAEDTSTSHVGVTSVYSVPVPPGYATPSNVPLITPAYTTPVIIRHLSMDEDGKLGHSALKNLVWIFILAFERDSTVTGLRAVAALCPFCFSKALPQGNGD